MIGFIVLTHQNLDRAAALVTALADQGCAVALHVDARAEPRQFDRQIAPLAQHDHVVLALRHACEWGTFSLVRATCDAAQVLLDRYPDLSHVTTLSGACLPIRPLADYQAHLLTQPDTDFIEALPLENGTWVRDGLGIERATLYHPFAFRTHRRAFDRSVRLQRLLGVRRRPPGGMEVQVGSQWWCLSRETLHRILTDPLRPRIDRFFRRTWIPDESYFQTLARRHARTLIPISPTLASFDPQGKPHQFYDDHLDLLLNADQWFARKIWPGADRLYDTLLGDGLSDRQPATRNPALIEKRLRRAHNIRVRGREGLLAAGRHPVRSGAGRFQTARAYTVFDGFDQLMPDLQGALNADQRLSAHSFLFHPDGAKFRDGQATFVGNIASVASIRDLDPVQFLINLIWADRRRYQVFSHDFEDLTGISRFILDDPNAHIVRFEDSRLLAALAAGGQDDAATRAASRRDAEVQAAVGRIEIKADFLSLGLADVLTDRMAFQRDIEHHLPPYADLSDAVARMSLPNLAQDDLNRIKQ